MSTSSRHHLQRWEYEARHEVLIAVRIAETAGEAAALVWLGEHGELPSHDATDCPRCPDYIDRGELFMSDGDRRGPTTK